MEECSLAEVKWIKIVTDIFDDDKIKLIEAMPESDSIIVIWFKLLCFAGKSNNNGVFMLNNKIAYTDEMFATVFRKPITVIRLALSIFENYGMIEVINGVITIPNWEKHQREDKFASIREYNRAAKQKERNKKQMLLCQESVNDCQGNFNESQDTDIDIDKEEEYNNMSISIDEFFDTVWKLYPRKEGKGSISPTQKKKLYKYGIEQIIRCIKRYEQKIQDEKIDKKFIKMGSTFFNSGYIDYLDENYPGGGDDNGGDKGNGSFYEGVEIVN